ncbi:GDSL-type esterase/lipase family protein [Streptomyces sp. NPDC049813]|uniref:GDSL-type esterase/lipase family protein n=1 Tax=Streptomyces sp. NPDC049813 TaxID=3365597 RepID=UPI00379D6039
MTQPTWTTAHFAALAAPDARLPFLPVPLDLSGQSVRQTVRLARGGRALRLVFSNAYGERPLILEELTVSSAQGERRLGRWEIPSGAVETSAEIGLPVEEGDDLVVTARVADGAPAPTYLHSAQRTGSAGDVEFTSLYWLTQVLVDDERPRTVVVAFGDSITRGDGTTVDGEARYPDHLRRALAGTGAVVLNAGLGANRVRVEGYGVPMVERFARVLDAVPEATHVTILGGTNDIALPSVYGDEQPAPQDLAGSLLTLAAQARDRGVQPVLGTVPPFGAGELPVFQEPVSEHLRTTVNKTLAAQRDYPVIDFAAALADPDRPAHLAPAHDSGDGFHPSDAGARAMAVAAAETLAGLGVG